MVRDSSQLSPRSAILFGLAFMAAGVVPILAALGMLPVPLTRGTPAWIGVCAGLVFVLGGAAIINGYAIAGGAGPDGDLPPGTPFGVRLAQYLLGLGICGLFTAIAGWIAFGKGERHFSTTVNLPFLTRHGVGNEWMGRAAFGLGAILVAAFTVFLAVVSVRRLRRARSTRSEPVRPSPTHLP
ncbi:MAG TPA: hypothetical protein VGZ27_06380 [Vicinamibacterales bacterium]|nr:hypothetical protein [Vicinamibacterales bacterium]